MTVPDEWTKTSAQEISFCLGWCDRRAQHESARLVVAIRQYLSTTSRTEERTVVHERRVRHADNSVGRRSVNTNVIAVIHPHRKPTCA